MPLPVLELAAGFALGLSLAAPPGPVLALMVREASGRGPWAGFRVALGATCADLTFALLALAGAIALLAQRPTLLGAVSLVAAALLAFYAWGAASAGRAARTAEPVSRGPPVGFRAGYLAAITSPFNLAWWVGPGTALLANEGAVLAVGMFAGILSFTVVFVHAVHRLGQRVRRFEELAAYVSAVILAAFALLVGWRGLGLLGLA